MRTPNNLYIYGRKPVLEALQTRANEIDKIFIRNNVKATDISEITTLVSKNSVSLSWVPSIKIEKLVGRVNDQGVVALMSAVKYTDFFDWVEELDLRNNPAVLLLDGIEDPHNLGAILRTAAAAGISAVIVPGQGQAPVNATVFKTSAGTAGRIPIIRVHDTNQGIKDLKAAGFSIVALVGDAEKSIWNQGIENPIAFVIGSEGKGIHPKVLKRCDDLISIPMVNDVESLNASVSAALVSYEWKRRKLL